jgi:ferredoxin--NADP+ reductase
VIGTNKRDAQETVDRLVEDLHEGRLPEPSGDGSQEAVEALICERKPEHVTYSGWELIDAVEKAAGEPLGRPRVKLTTVERMLEAAKQTV